MTAAEKKTAELLTCANGLLAFPKGDYPARNETARPPGAWDLEYLRLNAEPLSLALDALRGSQNPIAKVRRSPLDWWSSLALLIDISARQLEVDGKLEEAWDRHFAATRLSPDWWGAYNQLPLWAAQPGQTRERIIAAIKQLEQFEATLPLPTDAVKSEYLRIRPLITGGPDALVGRVAKDDPSHLLLWSMLPWERSRASRLLNVITAENLRKLDFLLSGIADGRPVIRLQRFAPAPTTGYDDWLKTTYLLTGFYTAPGEAESLGKTYAWEISDRRATRLVMALVAWKADHHGDLPERLDQLVGVYIDKLPLDPFTGRDFVYMRSGIALPNTFSRDVPPQLLKPFIWSPGESVRPEHPARDNVTGYRSGRQFDTSDVKIFENNQWRKATDEVDIWLSGDLFEIP